jgi:protein phosphatase
MDGLLSIGEFSPRCGLSPKVLRTYAAAGLLSPAAVDRTTGYRYYAMAQLNEAKTIAALRRAGVSLRDIASLIGNPTTALLDQWERDLDIDVRTRRQAPRDAREQMGFATTAESTPTTTEKDSGGKKMIHLTAESVTDIGQVRGSNEDAVLVGDTLFAVADGMGGKGDIASLLALQTLEESFFSNRTAEGLRQACREANRAVWGRSEEETERTMGTTLTAVGVIASGEDEALAVVSVGDSRAYLVQHGVARRVTEDHSLVGDLVRAGELTEEEARVHPDRSILTRALGVGSDVEPDLVHVSYEPGDRLLLCTDGLFNELEEHEIGTALSGASGPAHVAAELVRLANSRGGHDNVSVVVIDIERT